VCPVLSPPASGTWQTLSPRVDAALYQVQPGYPGAPLLRLFCPVVDAALAVHFATFVSCVSQATLPSPSTSPTLVHRRSVVAWDPACVQKRSASDDVAQFLVAASRLLTPDALSLGTLAGAPVTGSHAWELAVIAGQPFEAPALSSGSSCSAFCADARVPVVAHVPWTGRFFPASLEHARSVSVSDLCFRSSERWYTEELALEVCPALAVYTARRSCCCARLCRCC
jgi:hypothetical protein